MLRISVFRILKITWYNVLWNEEAGVMVKKELPSFVILNLHVAFAEVGKKSVRELLVFP